MVCALRRYNYTDMGSGAYDNYALLSDSIPAIAVNDLEAGYVTWGILHWIH